MMASNCRFFNISYKFIIYIRNMDSMDTRSGETLNMLTGIFSELPTRRYLELSN